jgi:hypothetical protein
MNRRDLIISTAALCMFPLEGCDTTWINTAVADIPAVQSVVVAILGISLAANPILDAAVLAGIKIASTAATEGLVTLQAIMVAIQKNPNASNLKKAELALQSVMTNLNGILAAAHVDNPGLQATIAAGVALGLETLSTILSLIPQKQSASRLVKPGTSPKLLTASQIKTQFNKVATANGYSSHTIK